MPQSKENIQAKLAEYVEGTLDAEGRAEIEQHLADHPEHRRLMADFAEVRAVLRNLPRQPAPADLTDLLQGQLERAVLLDDGFDGGGSLRIRRWPQVMAVAAIVLLAVGLGLVVYVTLPPEHPSGFTIIEREVPGEVGVAAPQATEETSDTPNLTANRELVDRGSTNEQSPAGVNGDAIARMDQPMTDETAPDASHEAPAVARPLASEAQPSIVGWPFAWTTHQLPLGLAIPGNDVVVLMAGEDSLDTDEHVVALFHQQNLNWERIGPSPAPGEPSASPGALGSQSPAPLLGGGGGTGGADDPAAAMRPMQLSRDADEQANEALSEIAPATTMQRTMSARSEPAPPEVSAVQNSYVVRDVTRRQAEQLLASLSQDDRLRMNQVHNWFDNGSVMTNAIPPQQQMIGESLQSAIDAPADAPMDARQQTDRQLGTFAEQHFQLRSQDTLPDDQPISVGDTIEIQIDELVGPGVTPQTEETVDATGGVKLQMIPVPVRAEGRRIDELEKVIADRYRESNLIDNPTVRVRRAGATTQPVDDDQRVDLLIIVQNRATLPAPVADEAKPPIPPTTQPLPAGE